MHPANRALVKNIKHLRRLNDFDYTKIQKNLWI